MSCLSLSRLCSPGVLSHVSSPDSSPDSGSPLDPKCEASHCACLGLSKTAEDNEDRYHIDDHAHLTNCVHLKNRFHTQKHKMVMEARHPGELPLMRELTALSRSKSLRDPSIATCSTWKSPQRVRDCSKRIGSGGGPDPRDDSRGRERVGDAMNASANKRDESKTKEQNGSDSWNTLIGSEQSQGKERALAAREVIDGSKWDGNIVDYIGGEFAEKTSLAQISRPSRERKGLVHKSVVEREITIAKEQDTESWIVNRTNTDGQASKTSHGSKVHPDTSEPGCRAPETNRRRYGKSRNKYDAHNERGQIFDIGDQLVGQAGRRVLKNTFDVSPEEILRKEYSLMVDSMEDADNLEQVMSLLEMNERKSDQDSAVGGDHMQISPLSQQIVAARLGFRSRSQSPLLARNTIRKYRRKSVARISQTAKASRVAAKDYQSFNKQNGVVSGDVGYGNRSSAEAETQVLTDSGSESEHRNGCGIPWYWSRLQKNRAKNFIDFAGRSLACGGHPEFSRRGEGTVSRARASYGRELVLPTFESDRSCSSLESVEESLPFMLDPDLSLDHVNTTHGSANNVLSPNELLDPVSRERKSHPGVDIFRARLRQRLGLKGLRSSSLEAIDDGRGRGISQRYRPKSFGELVGQGLVVQALRTAILKEKVASFYLFQGPRGTGKTSTAGIFASALVCLSSEEFKPCGRCRECLACNLGGHVDVVEIDSTILTDIDTMKHFLDYVALPPSGKYKVSIIDECHLVAPEIWNRLLKSLEESPPHVVFIFVTSDPENIPRTVTSRCHKFVFTKIRCSDVVARLQQLAWKEKVEVEQDALELIALRADGSLRDAETTLDQLCLSGNKITLSMVQELVGLIPQDKLLALLDMAMTGHSVETVKRIRELLVSGIEALDLLSQLATLITDFIAGDCNISKMKTKQGFFEKQSLTKKGLARLRQALRILSEAEKQIRGSNDQTTWLTASLLQLAPDCTQVSRLSSPGGSSVPSIISASDNSEKDLAKLVAQKPFESHMAGPPSLNETASRTSKSRSKERRAHLEAAKNGRKSNRILRSPRSSGKKTNVQSSSFVRGTLKSSEGLFLNQDYVLEPSATYIQNRLSADSNLPHEAIGTDCIDAGPLAGRKALTPMHQQKMADIWRRALQGSRSKVVKQLLKSHGELVSLVFTEACAVAYVEFRNPQQKLRAERSLSSISHTFQAVLGCPVEVRITLASFPAECERIKMSDCMSLELESRTPASNPEINSAQILSRRYLTTVAEQNTEVENVKVQLPLAQSCSGLTSTVVDRIKEPHFHCNGGVISPNGKRLEKAWVQEAPVIPPFAKLDHLHSERYKDLQGLHESENGPVDRGLSGLVSQVGWKKEGSSQDMQFGNKSGSVAHKSSRHLQTDFRSSGLENELFHLERENLRFKSRTKSGGLLCWKMSTTDEGKIKPSSRRHRRKGLLKLVPCGRASPI